MCEEFQNAAVCSMIPDLLMDIEKTLFISRQQKIEKYSKIKDLIESQTMEINQLNHQYSVKEKKEKEKRENLVTEIEALKEKITCKINEENTLRNKILEAKRGIDDITSKKPNLDEVSVLHQKIEMLKVDINNKKRNIVHDLEQFKVGIWFFKQYLHCTVFYVPDNQILFTPNVSAKTASEASEYIKFKISDDAITFQFVEMHPKLKSEQRMVDRFNKTGDIQGFVLHFWKSLKLIS